MYPNRRGSSVWGWVSPRGRQIALIGQHTGTAFVEVSYTGKMTYLGRLPAQDDVGSAWREIRVLKNMAIIGSEAIGHNVQVSAFVSEIDGVGLIHYSDLRYE